MAEVVADYVAATSSPSERPWLAPNLLLRDISYLAIRCDLAPDGFIRHERTCDGLSCERTFAHGAAILHMAHRSIFTIARSLRQHIAETSSYLDTVSVAQPALNLDSFVRIAI